MCYGGFQQCVKTHEDHLSAVDTKKVIFNYPHPQEYGNYILV